MWKLKLEILYIAMLFCFELGGDYKQTWNFQSLIEVLSKVKNCELLYYEMQSVAFLVKC